MIGARVGAVMAARKRGMNLSGARNISADEEEELQQLSKDGHQGIEDVDIRENTKTRLKFRKIPWKEWICGFICLFVAFSTEIYIVEEMAARNKKQTWF